MPANRIEELGNYFYLWKNPELPVAGSHPFKDIWVEWGQSPGGVVKIRRLVYPKRLYQRPEVEAIRKKTASCPLCKEGKQVGSTKTLIGHNPNPLVKYTSLVGDTSMAEMFEPGRFLTWYDETGVYYLPEMLATLLGNVAKLTGSVLGQKIAQGIAGLIGTMVTEIPQVSEKVFTGEHGPRLKKTAREIFSHLLAQPLDPSPEEMEKLASELESLRRGIQFKSPQDIMAAFVRRPEEIQMKFNRFFSSLGVALPKLELPSFGGGFDLGKLFGFPAPTTTTEARRVAREAAAGLPPTITSVGEIDSRRMVTWGEEDGKSPRPERFGYGTGSR